MKKLSQRDQFIKDNLDKLEEYYIIISCRKTGKKSYTIITNLYCDPFYFIDLKGDYRNGFYLSVNAKQFMNKFRKHKSVFVENNSSFGFDRLVFKRI